MELSVVVILIGMGIVGAGFLSDIGSGTKTHLAGNLSSAVVLLFTYVFIILSMTNSNMEGDFWSILSGGIPIIGDALDYESVTMAQSIAEAIIMFFYCVLIIAITQIVSVFLPKETGLLANLFIGVVLSAISFLLNYYLSQNLILRIVLISISVIITALAITSFIVNITQDSEKEASSKLNFLQSFSKTKLAALFRNTFFKGIVYVIGIYVLKGHLQKMLPDAEDAFKAVLGQLLMLLMPIAIMIIGMMIMMRSVFRKK